MPVALRSREVPVALDAIQTHGKLVLPAFRPEVSNQKYSINFPVPKFFPTFHSGLLHCPKTPQNHIRNYQVLWFPPFPVKTQWLFMGRESHLAMLRGGRAQSPCSRGNRCWWWYCLHRQLSYCSITSLNLERYLDCSNNKTDRSLWNLYY